MGFGGLSVRALACCEWLAALGLKPLGLPRTPTDKIPNKFSQDSLYIFKHVFTGFPEISNMFSRE